MTAANDSTALYVSDTNYVSTSFLSVGTGVLNVVQHSPYGNADFNVTGLQVRLVSAGLRIRYRGTKLNQGGSIFPVEHPNHISIVGLDVPQISEYQKWEVGQAVSQKDWVAVTYTPADPNELVYEPSQFGCNQKNLFMGALLQSAAPNDTFQYQFSAHWEVIGQHAANKTATHVSPHFDQAAHALSSMGSREISRAQNDQAFAQRLARSASKNDQHELSTLDNAIGFYDQVGGLGGFP